MGQMLDKPVVEKETREGANSYLHYGCASMQGYRVSMEDRHNCETKRSFPENTKTPVQTLSFFAVFDGHSGQSAAHFCAKNLIKHIMKNETNRLNKLAGSEPPAKIFTDDKDFTTSYLQCDEEFSSTFKENLDHSGTTCISTVIVPYHRDEIGVICGNVGDSRCVAYDGERDRALSFDHKPTNREESDRILKAGGYVEFGRVNGTLALSRAFGDVAYKRNDKLPPTEQCVISVPGIERFTFKKKKGLHQFVVLACDGIWDVMNNREVCEFVKERLIQQEQGTYYKKRDQTIGELYARMELEKPNVHEPQEKRYDLNTICSDLLDECVLRKDSKDNVSAIIVLLNGANEKMMAREN